jgi:hypothetical protein
VVNALADGTGAGAACAVCDMATNVRIEKTERID